MGHRYIGAKTKILKDIMQWIGDLVPNGGTVADLMCGSGAVSLELRKHGYIVKALDVMSQAYHVTKAQLLLNQPPSFDKAVKYFTKHEQMLLVEPTGYESIIQTINNLTPIRGYFWREFSPDGKPMNGSSPRKYFTSENAKKIDAAILFIKNLVDEKCINDIEHSLLINDLIMAANDIANIAGTYGHYLSKFVSRALQPMKLDPMDFERGGQLNGHQVFCGYAEKFTPKIEADLYYIDPPYMKRQYAANYHILETIARGDEPEAAGKSGLRPWRDQYSDFCSKVKIRPAFKKIITGANSGTFLISYGSEGLLSKEEMISFLSKFGDLSLREFSNKRFKSRNERAQETVTEYLFCLHRR